MFSEAGKHVYCIIRAKALKQTYSTVYEFIVCDFIFIPPNPPSKGGLTEQWSTNSTALL